MAFLCDLHQGETFEEIPPDAIQIGTGNNHGRIFRFRNGTMHRLRKIQEHRKVEQDCPHCIEESDEGKQQ